MHFYFRWFSFELCNLIIGVVVYRLKIFLHNVIELLLLFLCIILELLMFYTKTIF